jgi:hypothetical protein
MRNVCWCMDRLACLRHLRGFSSRVIMVGLARWVMNQGVMCVGAWTGLLVRVTCAGSVVAALWLDLRGEHQGIESTTAGSNLNEARLVNTIM